MKRDFAKTLPAVAVVLFAAGVMAPGAWSATATIAASKDTTIFQNAANNSAGGGPGIFVGTTGGAAPRRGLLAFDIAANLPAGAIITSAELRLHLGNAPNDNPQTIGLHRLTVDWGEGTAGSSTPAIGGSGGGFPAAAGDATWNERFFGSTAWSNPGGTGDFNPVPSGSAVVTGPVETAFTWLSTPALVSDAQGWLAAPATNFGWALVNANETSGGTVKAFYSHSATQNAAGNPLDPSLRPALMITYRIPEPSLVSMLLPTTAAAFILRRRKSNSQGASRRACSAGR
jgi:hypothetical protein